jgi:Domain of unknown function (DUF5666)
MMRRISSATLLFLAFSLVSLTALAHGTDKHVLGTVTKITDSEITVQAQDGTSQVVKIAPDTSFVKSGANATLKDLKVGDRVVIHAKPVDRARSTFWQTAGASCWCCCSCCEAPVRCEINFRGRG